MQVADVTQELAMDWASSGRRLLMFDEGRWESDGVHLTAFVFLITKTNVATQIAEEFARLRELLPKEQQYKVLHGTELWPLNRSWKEPFREQARAAIQSCPGFGIYIGSNAVVRRLKREAPGGIEAVNMSDDSTTKIRGREMVPFLNSLKRLAIDALPNTMRVDVLADSSGQLGTDLLLPSAEHVTIFEPATLNASAPGHPEPTHCATEFRLIFAAKQTTFRDLLLLPDAVAHLMKNRKDLIGPILKRAASEDTFIGNYFQTSVLDF